MGSLVLHEIPEEGRRTYRLKRCAYNNEDKDNSPNILRDKNAKIRFNLDAINSRKLVRLIQEIFFLQNFVVQN